MSKLHTSLLGGLLLLLFLLALALGSVHIPLRAVVDILTGGDVASHASWRYIIMESRLPAALTAALSGAALSVAGLLLQTAFRNPLAGPSLLGLDAGANLGVALVVLTGGASLWLIEGAALVGAAAVLGCLLLFSALLRGRAMLLIVGLMISYMTSSVISLLNFQASAEGVRSFILWGMGGFTNTTPEALPYFAAATLVGLALAVCLVKPLNALTLGDHYAEALGINLRRTRALLLITCALLAATSTAFCGPIAFIGLAVPHLARLLTPTADHRRLLPATLLTGSCLTLLCHIVSTLPSTSVIPINVLTPLIGAPTVIYVIMRRG